MSEGPQERFGHEPEELPSDVRNWAVLCHLSAYAGLLSAGVAMFFGPLVIWLLKRDDHPFIDDQGKEALNFQISMLIYYVFALVTICFGIGLVLAPLVVVFNVVFVLIAAVKASAGVAYRYPLTIRLIT